MKFIERIILRNSFILILVFTLLLNFQDINCQTGRIQNLHLEPIQYISGPNFLNDTHAFVSFEILPGTGIEFLNARFKELNGDELWLLQNIPIPPLDNIQPLSVRINTELFTPGYPFLDCHLSVGIFRYQSEESLTA